MKNHIARILIACSIFLACLAVMPGCNQPPAPSPNGTPVPTPTASPGPVISDVFITAGVSAGTSAGLRLTITDAAKRRVIAQYLNTYASALRTITGNPTDTQLTQQLMAFIPPAINQQYPELGSFAVPLVVSFYDWAKARYGSDATTEVRIFNDIGAGLETGSACCLQ